MNTQDNPQPIPLHDYSISHAGRRTILRPERRRRWRRRGLLALALIVGIAASGLVGCMMTPAIPTGQRQAPEEIPYTTETIFQRLPPLTHERGTRWPMVIWTPFCSGPQDTGFQQGKPAPLETYRELLRRGFVQPVRTDARYIPIALALQEAGCPVIFVEGVGGPGPYAAVPDWQHQLPKDYDLQGKEMFPCPGHLAGWEKRADELRATLKQFCDAGVKVSAAWLDWEGEPRYWPYEHYRQMSKCLRCKQELPASARRWFLGFLDYAKQQRLALYSRYLAAPILEVFPAASVANWDMVCSSDAAKTENYWGDAYPEFDLGPFTDAMPAVYGSSAVFSCYWRGMLGAPWNHWRHRLYVDDPVPVTDQVYTHVMLRVFSREAASRQVLAPGKGSVPWVSRYVIESQDNKRLLPMLSRERYREILRHVWLRGATAMQVFNPDCYGSTTWCIYKLEDAAAVYDEMMAWRRFLEAGTPLNFDGPAREDAGAVWSGLRLDDEALIGGFTQGSRPVRFRVRPWASAAAVELQAVPAGTTWLLRRTGDSIMVEAQPPAPDPDARRTVSRVYPPHGQETPHAIAEGQGERNK